MSSRVNQEFTPIKEVILTQPLGKNLSFLEDPRTSEDGGGPGGSEGSEKHIWKIFYRGDPKIGTPGTPQGSKGTKKIFGKIFV